MQIGAEHLTISAKATIGAAIVESHSRVQPRARADPSMNFITTDRGIFQTQLTAYITQLLLRLQHRAEIQKPQPRAGTRCAFQPVRVVNLRAKHLQPAADTQQLAAIAQMLIDSRRPTLLTQKSQIAAYAFRAGQDNQVGRRNGLARADKGQLDLRVQAQRIEIGVVADTWQHRHHHLDPLGRLGALANINGVLGLQMEIHQIRQYAQYRFAGALLQPIQPRLQQGDITSKAVDHKTLRSEER